VIRIARRAADESPLANRGADRASEVSVSAIDQRTARHAGAFS
jgi:hypothetical protein